MIANTARWAALTGAAAVVLAVSAAAGAGAQWVRAPGDRVTIVTASVHRLDADSGEPDLIKEEAALYAEQGVTPRVTLIGRAAVQSIREDRPIERRTVTIDKKETVVLIEPERQYGVGGVELGARFHFARRGPWTIAGQGVFGVPASGENQINNRFGEGGGDVDLRLQAGRGLGGAGYFGASAGWRNRRGEDRDEIRLDLSGGRPLGRGVHIFVQSYSVWSVAEGPAAGEAYSGHRLQTSLIIPVTRRARLQIGVLGTMLSENMAREQAVSVSLWRRF